MLRLVITIGTSSTTQWFDGVWALAQVARAIADMKKSKLFEADDVTADVYHDAELIKSYPRDFRTD